MPSNPRQNLTDLIAALEYHFELVANADDAFFTYDDVLFTEFDAELPFEILDDDLDDDEDDVEEDDPEDDDDDDDDDALGDGVDIDVIWE